MTVEAAIGLCALSIVLAMALAGVAAVTAQLRCTDAAREAARLVARGERDRAADAVARIAPKDAQLAVHLDGDEINVEVTGEAGSGLLPMVRLHGQAYAILEPVVRSGPGPDPGTGTPSGPVQ